MWKKQGRVFFCPHENNSVIYPLRPVITKCNVYTVNAGSELINSITVFVRIL